MSEREKLLKETKQIVKQMRSASHRGEIIPVRRPPTFDEYRAWQRLFDEKEDLLRLLEDSAMDLHQILVEIQEKINFFEGEEENGRYDLWKKACYDLTGKYSYKGELAHD